MRHWGKANVGKVTHLFTLNIIMILRPDGRKIGLVRLGRNISSLFPLEGFIQLRVRSSVVRRHL